jgi:hypothetical protein
MLIKTAVKLLILTLRKATKEVNEINVKVIIKKQLAIRNMFEEK